MLNDPRDLALLLVRAETQLRLLQVRVAEHRRAITQVEASLAEVSLAEVRRRARVTARRRSRTRPDALPTMVLYLWLVVIAVWMVALWEALMMTGR